MLIAMKISCSVIRSSIYIHFDTNLWLQYCLCDLGPTLPMRTFSSSISALVLGICLCIYHKVLLSGLDNCSWAILKQRDPEGLSWSGMPRMSEMDEWKSSSLVLGCVSVLRASCVLHGPLTVPAHSTSHSAASTHPPPLSISRCWPFTHWIRKF